MDGGNYNPEINLQQEMIYAENINDLFKKYHVPHHFDLLSIDIDFNDYWVCKALDTSFRPSVIVAEINASLGSKESLANSIRSRRTLGWDPVFWGQFKGFL